MKLLPSGMLKIKLEQVLWITIAWTIIGALDAMNLFAVSQTDLISGSFTETSFQNFLLVKILASFTAGIISGAILIFYLRERFRNESFGISLLINCIAISTINFLISGFLFYHLLDPSIAPEFEGSRIIHQASDMLRSSFYTKNLIFWTLIVSLTVVFLHVNDKYGPGVLMKLLLGRYHSPREEDRIFMFVDIRSSTTIAERMGHIQFFNLLNDFFADITNPIIYTSGEVYQYVGDEVVISWTMKNGLKKANCIRCFYGMQEAIQKSSSKYKDKYGIIPEFKAGLHCGVVTTGEIGVIKKDIVFSGDVMNTASRIQSLCNSYGVNILLSKHLLDKLHLPPDGFSPERVGIIELKGKRTKVELYTFAESSAKETAFSLINHK